MSRQRGHWKNWPVYVGESPAAVAAATTTDIESSDDVDIGFTKVGDVVLVGPSNAAAALLDGELSGSVTFDPTSLVDGAGETKTVTVTGVALADFVTGVSFSLDLQGIIVTAYVSAADTVAVRFQNETGGTLDLASGTLAVRVNSGALRAEVVAGPKVQISHDKAVGGEKFFVAVFPTQL